MYIKILFNIFLLTTLPLHLLAVRVHCKHPERIREDHIHYCCKHPDGHNDITEACAKKTGFKLPSTKEEAPEDVTVEQAVRGACWAKCVFDRYGFLKKHELDMTAVRRHYKEVHKLDAEYEKEMISAFDQCHGKSEEATTHFMENPLFNRFAFHSSCDPKSSVILSCVIYSFFHNCPKNRWANTQECQQTLEFARKCKDALTTM